MEEQRGQTSDGLRGLESVLSFVETAGNVWNKVSTEYQAKQATSQPTITDKSDNGSANNNNKIDGNGALHDERNNGSKQNGKKNSVHKVTVSFHFDCSAYSTEIYCHSIERNREQKTSPSSMGIFCIIRPAILRVRLCFINVNFNFYINFRLNCSLSCVFMILFLLSWFCLWVK